MSLKSLHYLGMLFALLLVSCKADSSANYPVEVGPAKFHNNYDEVAKLSQETGKPIFAFFQEVPGWKGCKDFGREVMTNPVIVDTIENSFVPLLIHNNQSSGKELLKKFNEPSWNYQVIRFLDSNGEDIIPRKDRIWTLEALVPRMIQALEKSKQPIPDALKLLQKQTNTQSHETVAFSQYCYWTGEARLGALKGVITTEAGWIAGKEVTLVTYDPASLKLQQLIQAAERADVASSIYAPQHLIKKANSITNVPVGILSNNRYRTAKESDQKRQIRGTHFAKLDLTAAQATKVNAFARTNPQKAKSYLTQRQLQQMR